MLIERLVAAKIHRSKKAVLLLGPRQTGKSTLMRTYRPDLAINLARERDYLQFVRNPDELEQRLGALEGGNIETPAAIFAIELKASTNVGKNDLRRLASFASLAKKPVRSWVLYTGYARKRLVDVDLIPWEVGLRKLTQLAQA